MGAGTDALVAVQVGSASDSTFYAVSDKLGSVRAWVLRKDGSWRWAMRYRPYGAALDSTGTAVDAPYRWTGREYDPETGFYFLRARYYDPAVGRFTQEDPLGTAGGTNLYAYVDGQPLEARDPSGMTKDVTFGWQDAEAAPSLGFLAEIEGFRQWKLESYGRGDQLMDMLEDRVRSRPMTPEERQKYAVFCAQTDCSKVRIHEGTVYAALVAPTNGMATRGNDIYVGAHDQDWESKWFPGEFAHELMHVVQFNQMGPDAYGRAIDRAGLEERLYGSNSNNRNALLELWDTYNIERQGYIVEDCWDGDAQACAATPYRPSP